MHPEFIKCIFGIDKLAITPVMMINWVATISSTITTTATAKFNFDTFC